MAFTKIDISELSFNPFDKIGKQWMLLTGGNNTGFNTMTASWGQLGVLWNKNVLTCYIRPTRYTYGFVEEGECFTASFLGEEYRKALSFCGSHSGRDCDKAKEAGLTPVEIEGCMAFEEAELVLVCRKLYSYDLQESGFLTDDGIPEKFFNGDAYHRAYISEIVGVYVNK
ncbi:flavin reductase family protein [uncultured Ruminococcus sp.]|uniref:flavin reductase family protein n=1 Tax=uncultured Ruminococcus sp. TaxID=165186 RepID=UPI0026341E02|nr:flavin reductase family protein [uncultured Ruminococcus sp.]